MPDHPSYHAQNAPENMTCQRTHICLPHQAMPYKVVLHSDTDEITYIMFALYYAVNALTLHEAEQITLRAVLTGQAVVMVCPKEQAEYYRECLIHYHLTVTIEPDA